MKIVENKDKFEVKYWAVECPNCGEIIELGSKAEKEADCPYCDEEIVFED